MGGGESRIRVTRVGKEYAELLVNRYKVTLESDEGYVLTVTVLVGGLASDANDMNKIEAMAMEYANHNSPTGYMATAIVWDRGITLIPSDFVPLGQFEQNEKREG